MFQFAFTVSLLLNVQGSGKYYLIRTFISTCKSGKQVSVWQISVETIFKFCYLLSNQSMNFLAIMVCNKFLISSVGTGIPRARCRLSYQNLLSTAISVIDTHFPNCIKLSNTNLYSSNSTNSYLRWHDHWLGICSSNLRNYKNQVTYNKYSNLSTIDQWGKVPESSAGVTSKHSIRENLTWTAKWTKWFDLNKIADQGTSSQLLP